jgi:hypothetical protein
MYTLTRIIFDRSADVTWFRIYAQGSDEDFESVLPILREIIKVLVELDEYISSYISDIEYEHQDHRLTDVERAWYYA